MRFVVAVTDNGWFASLAQRAPEEVNFWRPGAQSVSLPEGTPWLFKLHAPENYIVGGGFFMCYAAMPIGVAWTTFGENNGTATLEDLRAKIGQKRRSLADISQPVGCVVLSDPFFWPREQWIAAAEYMKREVVAYKAFDTADELGERLWRLVAQRLTPAASLEPPSLAAAGADLGGGYGSPHLVRHRLHQGGFRTAVIKAYGARCAVTGERTLPALEAAHIRPFAQIQRHEVSNGVLFRSDIHNLFDWGYVTVDPQFRFLVSRSIREEFENGRDYYALHGRAISLPADIASRPDTGLLAEHASKVFRG